ncbi:hypothetical protein Tco_0216928 [Tanacetum coccineum]
MRSGLKTINTARSRAVVNAAKPKVVHNAVKRNRFHDVKASACWVWKPDHRFRGGMSMNQSLILMLLMYQLLLLVQKLVLPALKTAGDSIKDIAVETLVYIRRSAAKAKDKGKMEESESAMTKTKRQQEQERLCFEVAVRLQAELDKEERQRISREEGLIQELPQKIFIHAERSRR